MNKNILIVTSEFPPMPGGIGNHAYCLAKELSRSKHSVTILTEQREAQQGDWQKFIEFHKDLNIIGVHRKSILLFTYFSRLIRLYKLIKQTSHRAVFYSGKFSVWLNGLMPKTKSVVVIHGSEIKQNAILRILFERGLKRAKYIICVSNYTKEQLISEYQNLDTEKLIVINNGFQVHLPNNKSNIKCFDRKKLNLVTVGGIHKRKGQFNVVRCLPEIIKIFPQVKYNIVGLPLEKNELIELINSKNVHQNVVFHHNLDDKQVTETLNGSDIFMMLSEHLENGDFEGFGIAILEAMALGLPAIGTRNSGISDAIQDGYSGKLVNPKNTDETLIAIKQIVDNYDFYSTNAKKWAKNFRWDYKIAEYLSLIDKL